MSALIWCPFPDKESAKNAANALLDERLVACANLIPQMESLYTYEGKQQSSAETGALFKTRADLLNRAIERLDDLHPYDSPAIMGWEVDSTNPATAEWLSEL